MRENILLRAALTPPSVTNGAAPRKSCEVILERVLIKRFGKHIRMILLRRHVLNIYLAIGDQLAHFEVTTLDMTRSLA